MARGTSVEVNRSLIRPILFCGAEKRSVIAYGTISVCIVASSDFSFPGIIVGPVLFIISHMFFVWLAKKDPQMIALYSRHIRFSQAFFPARGGVNVRIDKLRVNPTVKARRG